MKEVWEGKYFYGDDYGNEFANKAINFSFTWTNTLGILKGKCIDDESMKLFNMQAVVEGFIDGNTISIIKKYPQSWGYDDDGKAVIHQDSLPQEIHYYGTVNNNTIVGKWTMMVEYILQNETIKNFELSGSWFANKVSV